MCNVRSPRTTHTPKAKKNPIRVLQINSGRSTTSHDLMEVTASSLKCDIAIMSEPNINTIKGEGPWVTDKKYDTALIIFNKKLRVGRKKRRRGYCWINIGEYRIVACYISPNCGIDAFEGYLQDIEEDLKRTKRHIILAGDFNAKSPEWGSRKEDGRGRRLTEWLAKNNLVVQNKGNKPTFIRNSQESIIDLTFSTENCKEEIQNWSVMDEESASLHQFIYFEIGNALDEGVHTTHRHGWNLNKLDPGNFKQTLEVKLRGAVDLNPADLMTVIKGGCDSAMPRRKNNPKKRGKYWWTDEIATQRAECNRLRRRKSRVNRQNTAELAEIGETLKEARKTLKKLIIKSKVTAWENLCKTVEEDPWGKAYQIIMGKLKPKPLDIPADFRKDIIDTLFPKQGTKTWIPEQGNEGEEIPDVTIEEVKAAAQKLKNRKAPGPDGIPPEIVKIVISEFPDTIRKTVDGIFKTGIFPTEWKVGRLVLVKKPGKDEEEPTSYRPLCLLDTMGKVAEHIIAARIVNQLEQTRNLSKWQFGFRKGKSTVDAIKEVVEVAETEKEKNQRTRGLCALVTIDIKNAFNTASWNWIMRELRKRNMPKYIRTLIASYFTDRKIIDIDGREYSVAAGVPQGSVLGPLLWNILYDGVLRLDMPENIRMVAYADDLAIIATARTEEGLMLTINQAMEKVSSWIRSHDLKLAPEKTEAVLLIGRKIPREPITFQIEGVTIVPSNSIKYLGVTLDEGMTYREHIDRTAVKAKKVMSMLTRLMPRKGGATDAKRRLLVAVVHSIILYASTIWGKALKIKRNEQLLTQVQRAMAIRVCRGYKTVATESSQVISGIIPIRLLVEERAETWGKCPMEKKKARERTINSWQSQWRDCDKGRWTYTLIPNLEKWYNRKHGGTSYYMTQVLTGHGCFMDYFHKLGIIGNNACMYCPAEDSVEHTVFQCVQWEYLRQEAESKLGTRLTTANIVNIMLNKREHWIIVADMLDIILERKERDKKSRLNI